MKSLKIRLELNDVQTTLARKHAGVARHAYNWGLSACKQAFEKQEKRPSSIDLHKKLVTEVKSKNEWYYEVSKCAPQQALRNLDEAYKRFFKVKGSKLPVFKKKGRKDSFYLEGNIEAKGGFIKLPKFGKIKLSEKMDYQGIKNVMISRQAYHWFVSFKIPFVPEKTEKTKGKVGVDLGIKTLATLSEGTVYEAIKPYKKYKRKLRIAQRQVSKKFQKGKKEQSKNYAKAKIKVAKLHYKISCIRKNALHQVTSDLAKNHSQIVIEDLNVSGMSKNHKLASAILDGGFYEFRRQLDYKCAWYGSELVVADRFFASSKTCSNCGKKKAKLSLKERVFCCEKCHFEADRDLNASINLKKFGAS